MAHEDGDTISHEPYDGFMPVALDFFGAAEVLSKYAPNCLYAMTFSAGHALECALKAYLTLRGVATSRLRIDYKHDLVKLRNEAIARGLPVPMPHAQWWEQLNRVYSTFAVKYLIDDSGLSRNATVLPDLDGMMAGIKAVLTLVQAARG
jgi:hypothetical protein